MLDFEQIRDGSTDFLCRNLRLAILSRRIATAPNHMMEGQKGGGSLRGDAMVEGGTLEEKVTENQKVDVVKMIRNDNMWRVWRNKS